MELTQRFVKAKRPCADGYRWFLRHQRDGADYQTLLDALVQEGRIDDACWLLDQFGATDTVLEVDNLDADAVVFAGKIVAHGSILVGSMLRSGGGVMRMAAFAWVETSCPAATFTATARCSAAAR